MRSKNYYKILRVNYTATQADIKKAYRKLAMIYHPDKNKEEAAESHFKEIQEAYYHLSDVHRRSSYDQKNWFKTHNGSHHTNEPLTALSIHKKTRKLNEYLKRIHKGDVNKKALAQYLHHLINTETAALIAELPEEHLKRDVVGNIMHAAAHIHPEELEKIAASGKIIGGQNKELNAWIEQTIREARLSNRYEHWKPWIILLITLLVCFFIYLAATE